ncbi:PAS domain S-box-containing protein [Alteromonadaceae bacterium Bs31]|nr:PAS domain S-box-containing protein [Alteromonadaceae bacterium Bs31]
MSDSSTYQTIHKGRYSLTSFVVTSAWLLLAMLFVLTDWVNNQRYEQSERARVMAELSLVRANLEGDLHANIQTVQGLVAMISLEPDLSQERFAGVASQLLRGHNHLKNIGASRGWVLSYIYPAEGNEKALGLDYRTVPSQYAGALRAKEMDTLVVAGPVDLKQGGQGMIGRLPVYVEQGGLRKFWGLVSAVIDLEKYYRSSGLFDEGLSINLAIRGKDGYGDAGEVFFGDAALFNSEAITTRVKLPAGEWVLAAEPTEGWPVRADNALAFRSGSLAILLVVAVLGLYIVRLVQRRNEQELRFRSLFDLSPLGIALNDFETGQFLEINDSLLRPTGYTDEEFKALSYWDLTPIKYKNEEEEQLNNLKANGRYGPYEKKYLKKDGSEYPVLLNGMLVEDRNRHKYIWSIVEDISERKAAEKALLDSQYQLQRFFDLAIDFPCIFTMDGTFEKVSNSFLRDFGYSETEITSQPFLLFVHPDDVAATKNFSNQMWQGSIVTAFINRFRRKDGEYVHLSWSATPDLQASKVYGMAKDVSFQLREKNKLLRQQEMLESMSKQARIGAWELNLETNRLTWSEMTKDIHQVPQDYKPRLDSALSFYKQGKSRARMEHAIQLAMEQGVDFSEELQIRTNQGADYWVCATGKPVFQDGRCVRVYGSFQDINARKLIEENMEHTRAELEYQMRMLRAISQLQSNFIEQKSVLDALNPLLLSILELSRSAYGFIAEINYRAEGPCLEIWACSSEGYLKRDDSETVSHELNISKFERFFVDGVLCLNPVLDNFVEDNSVYQELFVGEGKLQSFLAFPVGSVDGGIAMVVLGNSSRGYSEEDINYLSPIMASVGQYLAGIRGVRAREQAEKGLIAAKDAAEAAANAKSEFLAIMSHEIRTPLNGIMGMLNLLSRSSLNEEQLRKLTIAVNSAETLLTIINDILDFSKVDANKIDFEEIRFNLSGQLNEFAELMAMRAHEKDIELILDQTAIKQPMVLGDPGRIRQVLTNLVGNAIKFTERGEVVIRCYLDVVKNNAELRVQVSDTGIGIPEEKIVDLFDPFTQVDASTTRNFGGTGLGLAICKKLCQQMGGDISVSSKLGHGSEFTFTVLLKAAENLPRDTPVSAVDLRGKRVVIVDDNLSNAAYLKRLIGGWKAEVNQFISGDEALAFFSANKQDNLPDLLIVDQYMPGMNGDDLLRILKQEPFTLACPFIILSRSHEAGASEFSASGFSGHLSKPIAEGDLARCISTVLSGKNTFSVAANTLVQRDQFVSAVDNEERANAVPRILLVEDNPVNQDVAKMMLKDFGVIVDAVGNGMEALRALKDASINDHYSMVLMDCQMPEMDGYEASQKIREGEAGGWCRDIPIVAMTANAMKGDRDKCMAAGMSDYIAKPIDPDLLESKVNEWLGAAGAEPEAAQSPKKHEHVSVKEETSAWDKAALIKSLKGREDRARILLKSFSTRMPSVLEEFSKAVKAADMESVGFVAHSMKGSAGQIGGKTLQGISTELEKAAAMGTVAEDLCGLFYSETERLLASIEEYLESD